MGYSSWSDDEYRNISSSRKGMDYSTARSTVFSSSLKASLDPKGVKVRESRDSDDHPESNAIGVFFDVTGSMGGVPVEFAQHKLGGLMKMLVEKGVIPHPQVLFGAIGDTHSDSTPFQVGQFESGIEMDKCLTDIFLEGGGGGTVSESYGLAPYFFARHTAIDCWEKRGKKGYLFTLGDENVYPSLTRHEIEKVFGDNIEADISIADILREAESRYNVFHIVVAGGTSHGDDPKILEGWRKLLGERVLKLDKPENVCEMIAATIGLCEGHSMDMVSDVLRSSGSGKSVKSVTDAIVPLKDALARSGSGSISGKLPTAGTAGGTVRL